MFWQSMRNNISDKVETHRQEMLVDRIMTTMDLIAEHLDNEKSVADGKRDGVDAHVRRVYTGGVNLAELITSRLYEQEISISANAGVAGNLSEIGANYKTSVDTVNAEVKAQQALYADALKQIKKYAQAAQTAMESGDRHGYEVAKAALREGLLVEYETMRPRLNKVSKELTGVLSRIERSEKLFGLNGPVSDSALNRLNSFVARTTYHVEGLMGKLVSPMYDARSSIQAPADSLEFMQGQPNGINAQATYAKIDKTVQ
ncbi:MAG: hypothetical protein ABIJ34_03240 [archaeon]